MKIFLTNGALPKARCEHVALVARQGGCNEQRATDCSHQESSRRTAANAAHRSLDSDGNRADFSSLSMRAVNSVVKRFDRLRLIYSEFSDGVFACVDLSLVSTLSH